MEFHRLCVAPGRRLDPRPEAFTKCVNFTFMPGRARSANLYLTCFIRFLDTKGADGLGRRAVENCGRGDGR